jgi:phage terminase large subunit-like protein
MPRKNGKTATIAFLLLLHLCGPEAKGNSQLYSAAQSRKQAAVVFNYAAKCVRMSPDLEAVVIVRDTAKELLCHELGTYYHALSADASTAHGMSPVFAVHDELGQVKGPVADLYDAIETGMGAHKEPLSIIISTQAPTDNSLFSRLIDKAQDGNDPRTTLTMFSAPMDADPFDIETLKACNPAWGDFLNDEEVIRKMEEAKELSSQEPSYRNLHLNQRVETTAAFISRSLWQETAGRVRDDWADAEIYCGLDLSTTNDLTAFVAIANIDGVWEVKPTFWLPADGLREKSRTDKQTYDIWAKEGFLETTPGRSIEYEYVAERILAFCEDNNVKKIAFDRWNMNNLRPWLVKAGFTPERIEEQFEEFGQGFKSMSPALRDLESALLARKVKTGVWFEREQKVMPHPVLTMCAALAVVDTDGAENRKLNKAKAAGRIDGMVALAMAFGVAPSEVTPSPAFEIMVF